MFESFINAHAKRIMSFKIYLLVFKFCAKWPLKYSIGRSVSFERKAVENHIYKLTVILKNITEGLLPYFYSLVSFTSENYSQIDPKLIQKIMVCAEIGHKKLKYFPLDIYRLNKELKCFLRGN